MPKKKASAKKAASRKKAAKKKRPSKKAKRSKYWHEEHDRLIALCGTVPVQMKKGREYGSRAPYKATASKLKLFLHHLGEHGIVRRAARESGLHTAVIYEYRSEYPEFASKMRTAMIMGRRNTEDLAIDRATYGTPKIVERFDADGNLVGVERSIQYDNKLLLAVLAALRPSKWQPGGRGSKDGGSGDQAPEVEIDFRVAGKPIEELKAQIVDAIEKLSSGELIESQVIDGSVKKNGDGKQRPASS